MFKLIPVLAGRAAGPDYQGPKNSQIDISAAQGDFSANAQPLPARWWQLCHKSALNLLAWIKSVPPYGGCPDRLSRLKSPRLQRQSGVHNV